MAQHMPKEYMHFQHPPPQIWAPLLISPYRSYRPSHTSPFLPNSHDGGLEGKQFPAGSWIVTVSRARSGCSSYANQTINK